VQDQRRLGEGDKPERVSACSLQFRHTATVLIRLLGISDGLSFMLVNGMGQRMAAPSIEIEQFQLFLSDRVLISFY
jgi:hypothetical protein